MMETNGKSSSSEAEPTLSTSTEDNNMPTPTNTNTSEQVNSNSSVKEPADTSALGPQTQTSEVDQIQSSGKDSNGLTTHEDHEDSMDLDMDDDLPPHKLTIQVTSDSLDDFAGPEVESETEPPELTISAIESTDGESLLDSSHGISSLDGSVEEQKQKQKPREDSKSKLISSTNSNPKNAETRNANINPEEGRKDADDNDRVVGDGEGDGHTAEITKNNKNGTTESTTNSAPAPVAAASSSSSSGRKERKKRKTRSELDRLLMDEGTVKILMGPKPRSCSPAGSPASKKEKLSELQKNRDMVINQVRDSSKTKLFSKVSLRLKSKNRRQQQKEQKEEKKNKEGPSSKIIRRRSSSSNFNFSSRSPSPLHLSAPLQSSAEDLVQVRVTDSIGYITIDAEAITFNTQTSSRLTSILNSLKLDEKVTVVQVSTTCDYFIQGLDIEGIRSETDDSLRESMADSMIACLDTLLKTLINYPKVLVAEIRGDVADFGVLILGYFDLVYASDKATFQTNYGKNGYLPECLQLFPKHRFTHAMLYTGRKLTAAEALTSGLVTEVLWPAKFQEELASRIRATSSANQEVLLQTKLELNAKNSSKLELTRDLRSSWLRF